MPAESRERVGMKILSDLKLEYCEELNEVGKGKVDSPEVQTEMKLSDFKNSDKPIKVFSRLFGEEIYFSPSAWITHKLELKKHGLPIYTAKELIELVKNADQKELKAIHMTKKVFGGSILEIKEPELQGGRG